MCWEGLITEFTFIFQSVCHFIIKRTVNCMTVVQYRNHKCLSMWISYPFERLSGKELIFYDTVSDSVVDMLHIVHVLSFLCWGLNFTHSLLVVILSVYTHML
jgi:hypothetical protein